MNAASLQFIVPDGMVYNPASLTLGGASVSAINAVVTPGPGTGSTVVVNLHAENGVDFLPCAIPDVQYTATVNQTYTSGDPVLTRDPLNNTSGLTYSLVEGASGCTNPSSSSILIEDLTLTKIISNTPPTNGTWMPGDIIIYELAVNIPSGDADDVTITDFLPIPIHDVNDLILGNITSSGAWAGPFTASIDVPSNSVILDYGDITTPSGTTIIVQIPIVITTIPYKNGLKHSNFANLTTSNSSADALADATGTLFVVGAPVLGIDKSVTGSTNSNSTISSGNITGVDAFDVLDFELVVTNTGDAPAYDVTIVDAVPAGFNGCILNGVNPVIFNTNGNVAGFTGGFTGNNLNLTINNANPIEFSGDDDDALTVSFSCTANSDSGPLLAMTNVAEVTWASTTGGTPFPAVEDDATILMEDLSVTKVVDSIFPSPFPGNSVTIGDFVQYRVEVTIPEGEITDLRFTDRLDGGLAMISIDEILTSSGDITSSLGAFASLIGTEVYSSFGTGENSVDRVFDLDMGTITNSNTDNTVDEIITIVYTTSVINSSTNNRGDDLNNRFDAIWEDPNNSSADLSERVNASTVEVVEPELRITKSFLDNSLVPGNETFVTLSVEHSGSSNATAYDISFTDTLQLGLNYVPSFDNFSGTFSAVPSITILGNILTITMDSLTTSENLNLSFKVQLDAAYPICDSIENCSYISWESLPDSRQVGLPTAISQIYVGERTGDTTDVGGLNNSYRHSSCVMMYSTNEPTDPAIVSSGVVCEGEQVTLSVNSYTGSVVTYNWFGPGIVTGPSSNSNVVTINPISMADVGDYYIIVNVDGCVSDTSQPFNVQVNELPTLSPVNNGNLCMTPGQDLVLSSNTTNGTSPYFYSWTGPNSYSSIGANPIIPNPSILHAGTYFVTVTDANGCSAVSSTDVDVSEVPVQPILSSNAPVCEGNDLVINSQLYTGSSVSYNWTAPSGPLSINSNILNFNPATLLDAGTYSLSVTIDGCTSSTSTHDLIIHSNPIPPTPLSNSSICEGSTLNLLANNTTGITYDFSWLGPNGFTSSNENPIILNATSSNAGFYELSIIDSNNCVATNSIQTIINSQPIVPTVSSSDLSLCIGESTVLNVNTSYVGTTISYNWTTPSGMVVTTSPSLSINSSVLLDAGSYSVNVTVDGCNSNESAILNLEVFDVPLAPVITSVGSVCEGDVFSLSTSTVADSYAWTGPNGFTSNLATPASITASTLTAGTYTLIVTVNGCESLPDTEVITVNALPSVPSISGVKTLCNGDDIVLSTSSTCNSFLWIGPGGASASTLANPLLNTATNTTTIPSTDVAYAAGEWSVVCVSASGCESPMSLPITIDINPIPVAIATNDGPICDNGDVVLTGNTVSGATYQWYDELYTTLLSSNSTHSITGLASGSYTYNYIINSNGCVDTATTVVTVSTILAPPSIVASATSICEGDMLLLSSTTTADSYSWTGPNGFTSTSQVPAGIEASPATAGTYTLTVVIAGCGSSVATEVITVNDIPATPTLTASNAICEGDDIILSTTAVATNYAWTSPIGTVVITTVNNLTVVSTDATYGAGDWSLVTENANGCFSMVSNSETIVVNPLPLINAGLDQTVCDAETIILTGSGGVTYAWDNGVTDGLGFTQATGTTTYTVTGTDANGCVNTDQVAVTVNPIVAAPVVASTATTVCEGDVFSLSTSTVADSYAWTGPNGFTSSVALPNAITADVTTAGTYTLTVTVDGCISITTPIVITVNETPSTPTIAGTTSICDGDDIVLSTSSTCNSFLWIGPGGASTNTLANPLLNTTTNTTTIPALDVAYAAGEWSVVCVSTSGCESIASSSIDVVINSAPDTAFATSNSPVCIGSNIQLFSNGSLGATYIWSSTNGFFSSDQNPIIANADLSDVGDYSVTITSNGCSSVISVPTTVTVNTIPEAPVPTSNSPVCEGDTIFLFSEIAADAYNWSGPDGFFSTLDTAFIPNVGISNDGFYNLSVTINGCTSPIGQVEVDVVPTGYVPLIWSQEDTICVGEVLELQTNSFVGVSAEYVWYGPNGLLSTTTNPTYINSSAVVADSGEYYVQVILGTCNSLPSQIELIDVNSIPDIPNVTVVNPVCEGGVIQFTSTTTGDSYSWSGPNGFTSDLQNPTIISPASLSDAGLYSFSIEIDGCSSLDSTVDVVVNEIPETPILYSNSPVCVGDSAILYTTSIAMGYEWTMPDMTVVVNSNDTLVITPTTMDDAGTYQLQLNANGCLSAPVSIEVVIQDSISSLAFAGVDLVLCDGEPVINLNAIDNGTGFWLTPSNATIVSPEDPNSVVTNFDLDSTYEFIWTLTNGVCGNASSDTVLVYVADYPVANSDALTLVQGSSGSINVLANDSLPLNTSISILENPNLGNVSFIDSGVLYENQSENGLSDNFIYEICLEACPDMCDTAIVNITIKPLFNIPDIITPNGDGTNDAFVIEGIDNFPSHEVYIFNRWGNEVYFSENYSNDWSGVYNDEDLPAGTYYYIFINTESGETIHNGYITLHR